MAKLGEICTFQSGGTPSKSNSAFFGGNIPWITTVALNGNMIDGENAAEWITDEAIQKSAAKIVPANSIMVGTRVGIGKVAINTVPMSTSQDIVSLLNIDSERWDKGFLCKFILAKNDFLMSQARGATIKGIKIETLANLDIPELTLDEQRRIAAALDKVTDLIAQRRAQLDKLDLLVKSRFMEMFGDLANPNCPYKKYKLVDVCADSDDIKCGPFGTQLSKQEYQDYGVALWEIPQINSDFSTPPTHFLTQEKAEQLNAFSIVPGDIVMSRKGNVGRCALFPSHFDNGIMHSDVLRIRVDNQRVNPCFMMYQLHFSRAVQYQIEAVSTGAIMAGVNVTKLKNIVIHLPDLDQQESFCRFVQKKDALKNLINKSLEYLETLKQSLMQQYFE